MQRPIKFRAWDKRFKRMHSPFVELGTEKYLANFPAPLNEQPLPQNTVLMQYTGLKDKNGKEIYEGDIINDGDGSIGKVEWRVSGFEQNMINTTGWWVIQTEGEVIGNIYEHPNLLEEGA